MKYTSKLPDEKVNRPKEYLFLFALKLLSGLLVFVVLFYLIVTASVNIIAENLSPEHEAKIMKYVQMDIDMNQTQKSTQLQHMVDKLAVCAKLPYKVDAYVMDDFHVNAMAVPGAKMLVTKGLLHKVKTENELAMVLGHELGHFKHKDNIKSMGKGLIFAVAGMLLSSDNYGSLFSTTLEMTNNRYSQEQEMAADLFGVDMLNCAYGTANGATALFEKMKKEGEGWKYLLADHPDFIKRIKKMKAYIREREYDTSKKLIPLGRIYK